MIQYFSSEKLEKRVPPTTEEHDTETLQSENEVDPVKYGDITFNLLAKMEV